MARHAPLLFTVVAVLAVAAASASAYVRAADAEELVVRGASVIGDDSDELGLGGMASRRRLDDHNGTSTDANATSTDANATSAGYISYLALSADRVPCTQRGASYYNCQPGAEANPYTRGCSAITQCRG
ncbi:protein RALF-like 22 [Phragmites australis]|uniref:protein RALF-like 22 n=1 Tax=Phragmites australis TaxID=29695 RepID=UPI002D76AC9F|nr:protein RALF-like 22 [Phragmites australis]